MDKVSMYCSHGHLVMGCPVKDCPERQYYIEHYGHLHRWYD